MPPAPPERRAAATLPWAAIPRPTPDDRKETNHDHPAGPRRLARARPLEPSPAADRPTAPPSSSWRRPGHPRDRHRRRLRRGQLPLERRRPGRPDQLENLWSGFASKATRCRSSDATSTSSSWRSNQRAAAVRPAGVVITDAAEPPHQRCPVLADRGRRALLRLGTVTTTPARCRSTMRSTPYARRSPTLPRVPRPRSRHLPPAPHDRRNRECDSTTRSMTAASPCPPPCAAGSSSPASSRRCSPRPSSPPQPRRPPSPGISCGSSPQDMPASQFTKPFYQRPRMTFAHIAHFNQFGFYEHFFADLRGKVRFLEQTLGHWPVGDPTWTFVDVERELQMRDPRRRAAAALPGPTPRRPPDLRRP